MTEAQPPDGYWTVASEVHQRGWNPHVWNRADQAEDAVSNKLAELIDPAIDQELAKVVAEGLLTHVDSAARQRICSQSVWGIPLKSTPGPDILLVDRHKRILVVIENKYGGPSEAAPYGRFDDYPRFPDELAMSLPPRPRDDEYVPSGPWGNPNGNGPKLWQIDYYRCNTSWVRPPHTLDDAEDVVWLFLDWYGRSAAEVYPVAHTAHVWQATGYGDFADRLFAGYDDAISKGQTGRAQKLKDLICMLAG
jgi:hypothetical protein